MRKQFVKILAIPFLLIMVLTSMCVSITAYAQDNNRKVVRVGWHEPPFYIKDDSGRRSGYSYDYLIKLAAYTDWEYEYVEGSFSELLQMLKDGEIDLMSNVSYSDERAKSIVYSSIPMGTDAYYVFVSSENTEITSEDITTLNGKRIGVAKGSIQKDYYTDWAEKHGINAEVIEVNASEEDSIKLLDKEFDAFITLDVYGSSDTLTPVCKVGSSDFFFAVKQGRTDLLTDLDFALDKIQDENKYFDQQLYDKYLNNSETNRYLNTSEKDWLKKHKTIKVGYQDNYLAFCAKDPSTGELTGALRDYLDYASGSFENADIKFETICFSTSSSAIEALKNGEIDCMFPANLASYDAENLDLLTTPPLMHTEMDAVVRASDQKSFLRDDHVIVAVNEGNTNYDLFLEEYFPDWEIKYFKDTPTGLDAIANKEADCVIISNYRYSNISKQCEKLHLTTLYTGVDIDYYFAMNKGDPQLYSILAKVTNVVPDSTVNTALTYYSTEDVKTSFFDLIMDNLVIVLSVVSVVLLIILILVLFSIRAEKRVKKEKNIINDLNRKVFVDALTSVRNKGAYNDYIQKLQERIDNGEQFDFAIGIFDCNDLKKINDEFGHEKGDIYLKSACHLICKVYDHSPVFRIGGDEFAVVLQNSDFENREPLAELFEKRRKEITMSAENKWQEIHIASGIAVYDPERDESVSETSQRADKIMYVNKSKQKARKSMMNL